MDDHGTDRLSNAAPAASSGRLAGCVAPRARTALVAAMLSLAAMPGHAQKWVKREEGLLYDAQTLRVNGSLRQVWIQLDPEPGRKGGCPCPSQASRIRPQGASLPDPCHG